MMTISGSGRSDALPFGVTLKLNSRRAIHPASACRQPSSAHGQRTSSNNTISQPITFAFLGRSAPQRRSQYAATIRTAIDGSRCA